MAWRTGLLRASPMGRVNQPATRVLTRTAAHRAHEGWSRPASCTN
jgi:hypothetical protein